MQITVYQMHEVTELHENGVTDSFANHIEGELIDIAAALLDPERKCYLEAYHPVSRSGPFIPCLIDHGDLPPYAGMHWHYLYQQNNRCLRVDLDERLFILQNNHIRNRVTNTDKISSHDGDVRGVVLDAPAAFSYSLEKYLINYKNFKHKRR